VRGSVLIYHALEGHFTEIQKIFDAQSKYKSVYPSWRDKTFRRIPNYAYKQHQSYLGVAYDIPESQIMSYALRAVQNIETAYPHLQSNELPFAYHFIQATRDLDFFTTLGSPVDWWLTDTFPKGYGRLQWAVWNASKTNDFIDWLQFTVSTSNLSHMQNWAYANDAEKSQAFSHLTQHALTKLQKSSSYVWLAALSEVLEPDDPRCQIVIDEFTKIAEKVSTGSANQAELAAFSMILLNATRLSYGKNVDVSTWLKTTKNDVFKPIKKRAQFCYGNLILARESIDAYRIFASSVEQKGDIQPSFITPIAMKNSDDIVVYPDKSVNSLSSWPFTSLLPISELKRLSELPGLPIHDKRKLNRTIFLRSWVQNDYGDDNLLKNLAVTDPLLSTEIEQVLSEPDQIKRRAILLKMVMRAPALTYLMDVELFRGEGVRAPKTFSKYNPNDGSWWCETDTTKMTKRMMHSKVKKIGLRGEDPILSGGRYGRIFHAAGQLRAFYRCNNSLATDPELHRSIIDKLLSQHPFMKYIDSDEWKNFSTLPPAPVFFGDKVYEFENSPMIDRSLKIELLKLLARASRYTCRGFDGVYGTFDEARSTLKTKYGIHIEYPQ